MRGSSGGTAQLERRLRDDPLDLELWARLGRALRRGVELEDRAALSARLPELWPRVARIPERIEFTMAWTHLLGWEPVACSEAANGPWYESNYRCGETSAYAYDHWSGMPLAVRLKETGMILRWVPEGSSLLPPHVVFARGYYVGQRPVFPEYRLREEALQYARDLTERERGAGRLPASWSYRLPTTSERGHCACVELGDPNPYGLQEIVGHPMEWLQDPPSEWNTTIIRRKFRLVLEAPVIFEEDGSVFDPLW